MKPIIFWAAVGACMWALMGWAVVSHASVIEYQASGMFADGGSFNVVFTADFHAAIEPGRSEGDQAGSREEQAEGIGGAAMREPVKAPIRVDRSVG